MNVEDKKRLYQNEIITLLQKKEELCKKLKNLQQKGSSSEEEFGSKLKEILYKETANSNNEDESSETTFQQRLSNDNKWIEIGIKNENERSKQEADEDEDEINKNQYSISWGVLMFIPTLLTTRFNQLSSSVSSSSSLICTIFLGVVMVHAFGSNKLLEYLSNFTGQKPGEIVSLRAVTKFSSQLGTLFFTNLRLVWVQSQMNEPSLHLHLSEIKNQFISTPSSAKALLRLGVKDPKDPNATQDFLFEFTHSTNARTDLISFRDKIAQVVKQTAPSSSTTTTMTKGSSTTPPSSSTTSPPTLSSKNSPTLTSQQLKEQQLKEQQQQQNPYLSSLKKATVTEDEIKQRVLLLSSNTELKQLFDSLVGGGVIGESEFWESRREMLKNDQMRAEKQQVGMPSNILADVRPSSETCNAVRYRLTPSIIHQIFIQHPSVEKAYKANVPHKISEQEFWKKYVQSKYFHRDRNLNVPSSDDDLFSKYESDELNDINPLLDISAGDQDESGYGVLVDPNQDPDKLAKALPLLRKFNRHSALVLGSKDLLSSPLTQEKKKQKTEDDEQLENEQRQEQEKIIKHNKKVLNQHTIYSELQDEKTPEIPQLKIIDQKRYFEGHSATNSLANLEGNGHEDTDGRTLLSKMDEELQYLKNDDWNSKFTNILFQSSIGNVNPSSPPLSSSTTSTTSTTTQQPTTTNLQILSEISVTNSDNTINKPDYVLPEGTFKTDLYSSFRTSNELLRHFWATNYTPGRGPPPTPKQKERHKKIFEAIEKMYQELNRKKDSYLKAQKVNQSSLFGSLIKALEKALDVGDVTIKEND
eukprot:gene12019-14700_t